MADKFILYIAVLLLTTSCLRTRSDISSNRSGFRPTGIFGNTNVKEPQNVNTAAVVDLNKKSTQDMALLQLSLQEANDQIRELRGRVDLLENGKLTAQGEQGNVASKLKDYELALTSLEAEVAALKANSGSVQANENSAVSVKKLTSFNRAELNFNSKRWKDAISQYQIYRDKYPKGDNYPESTYKIGVCFQELNLKNEAKSFYQEVVQAFPKSKAAKKASFRLKQL